MKEKTLYMYVYAACEGEPKRNCEEFSSYNNLAVL